MCHLNANTYIHTYIILCCDLGGLIYEVVEFLDVSDIKYISVDRVLDELALLKCRVQSLYIPTSAHLDANVCTNNYMIVYTCTCTCVCTSNNECIHQFLVCCVSL